MRSWLLGLTLVVGACASAPSAPPASGPPAPVAAPPGLSPETAVQVCGPRASYEYVATAPTCADGTNPFDGDVEIARAARIRTVTSDKGITVDVYRVPCPEGPLALHIDMYECTPDDPAYEQMKRPATAPSITDHPIWRAYVEQGLAPLEALCDTEDPINLMVCVLALTSGSYLAEQHRRSADVLREFCDQLRTHAGSDPREEVIAFVAGMTSQRLRQLGKGWTLSDWQAAMRLWGEACRLEEGRADRLIERLQR